MAYDRLCAYCRRSLNYYDFEIEHIVPRDVFKNAAEWHNVADEFGLTHDFEVDGDRNLVAACGKCNREKGADLLPNIGMLLRLAERKEPTVQQYRERCFTDRQRQKLLAEVERGLDQDATFKQDLYRHLSINIPSISPALPTPWLNNTAHQRAKQMLGAASGNLLGWPQTTDGHWFNRVEFDDVVKALSTEQCHLLALLGPPGSGKSALLAHLGTQLVREGHVLLALKADLLPTHIASIRELDAWLDAPEPLPVILERLAVEAPVVILIDQIDALSELMDAHTERLFALIGLIDRVLLSPGIKVVISCREFDAQHDLRLRNLIENDRTKKLKLGDIEWQSVEEFLRNRGFQPEEWPHSVKRILCRPNALKLFAKHFQPNTGGPVFDTYQSMLEQVLQESVIRRFRGRTMTALYEVANHLASREELWLPRALFENSFREERYQLQAAGWIEVTPDGFRLGFTHQTMFDFIRARGFASQQVSLFDEVKRRQDSLAIRPLLWSAASYSRNADWAGYSGEVGALLKSPDIRPHIKILLVELLGAIVNPTREEATWLTPLLSDERIRPHIMEAIAKKSDWFALMKNDLAACGSLGEQAAYHASWAFSEAIRFDRSFVLGTMKDSWLRHGDLDHAIFNVFRNFGDWDEQSASIIETVIGRTSFAPMWICKMAESMARVIPQTAVRIVRLKLDQDLQQARIQCAQPPERPPSASIEELFAFHRAMDESIEPITQLLRYHGEWHGLNDVASAAPAEIVEGLWTWVEATSIETATSDRGQIHQYGYNSEWRFGQHSQSYLAQALWEAVPAFALADLDRFIKWVDRSSQSEWMPVHELIAHGLLAIAPRRPEGVLRYLLADSRRLSIGSMGCNGPSCELIRAIAPGLAESSRESLRILIRGWQLYDVAQADPERARNCERWNEEARSSLLHALVASDVGGELVATSKIDDKDQELSQGGIVKSPVTAEAMAGLSGPEILAVLESYPDTRAAELGFLLGGAAEVAAAFGQLAAGDPERATTIIRQLQPGRNELAAGAGLDSVSKAAIIDPRRAADFALELSSKGFSSDEFKSKYNWAMVSIANRSSGLADDIIEVLLNSVQTPPESTPNEKELGNESQSPIFRNQGNKQDRKSILWDNQGGVLPHGNFPIFLAIALGLLRRKPPGCERFLRVIEAHLTKKEEPAVWRALLQYLRYLAPADRTRSVQVVVTLFRAFPQIFASVEGVRFAASSHRWLPPDAFETLLEILKTSEWDAADRATGELLLLRVALVPDDQQALERFERAIEDLKTERRDLHLGIVRSAAETWGEPRLRDTSHRVLLAAIPNAEEDFAQAIMMTFSAHDGKRLPSDQYTSEFLSKVSESPNLLRVSASAYLVERLKELLEDNSSPSEVAIVAVALVEANKESIRNMSGSLSRHAEDLMNIALTLQRFPETRTHGTSIFEYLLVANAYRASETAKEVDRRF